MTYLAHFVHRWSNLKIFLGKNISYLHTKPVPSGMLISSSELPRIKNISIEEYSS